MSLFAAEAEPTIELSFKRNVPADGSTLRIGDVVLVRSNDVSAAMAIAQGEIVLQPGPGRSAMVEHQDVVAAIGKIDNTYLSRLKWSGLEQLSLNKAGQWLDADAAVAGAQEALQHWLESRAKSYELQLHMRVESKWMETGAHIRYVISPATKIRRLIPVQVEITDVSGKSRSFPIWFTTSVMQEVWVLTRDMTANETIASSDLTSQTLDIAALDGEIFSAGFNSGDLMVVSPAKAGAVLLESLVKTRPDVLVGETVSVKLNWPMVQLETTGLALQSAERGSRILIRNSRSGENLVARVTDRDVVEVGP